MGLDCYIRYDFKGVDGEIESEEIWYGRKESEIHGWMQRQSGISAGQFNCKELPLTEDLLNRLEDDMKNEALAPTSGFFFGSGNDDIEVQATVKDFVQISRDSLANGDKPYYYSWW